jgi:hypothetical protein
MNIFGIGSLCLFLQKAFRILWIRQAASFSCYNFSCLTRTCSFSHEELIFKNITYNKIELEGVIYYKII